MMLVAHGAKPRPGLVAVVGLFAVSGAACALPGYDFTGGGGANPGVGGGTGGGDVGGAGGSGATGTGGAGAAGASDTGGAEGTGGQGGGTGPYFGDCPGAYGVPGSDAVFDDFSDDAVSANKWWESGNATFTAGELSLSPTQTDQWAAVSSVLDVSLTDCVVQAEVRAVLSGMNDDTSLSFMGPNDEELALFVEGGILKVFVRPGVDPAGDEFSFANIDLETHRYWRIEERSGLVRFRTSADGKQWSSHHQLDPTPEWVTDGYVRLSTWMNSTSSPPARFDDVNVPP